MNSSLLRASIEAKLVAIIGIAEHARGAAAASVNFSYAF
jgi:hypothetical protein